MPVSISTTSLDIYCFTSDAPPMYAGHLEVAFNIPIEPFIGDGADTKSSCEFPARGLSLMEGSNGKFSHNIFGGKYSS